MATMHKFKILVYVKDRNGISNPIYPIIEAASETEAKRIAQAQYPAGDVRSVTRVR